MSDVGTVGEWAAEARRQESGEDHNIVRFYNKEKLDKKQSDIDGRPRYRLVPYVEIFAPGQIRNTRIDRKARDEDKQRWPQQWEKFEKASDEVDGTPIEAWPYLNRAQVAELKAIGFLTVESVAETPDSGLERLGPGARDLQNRARQWLKPQSDTETELRTSLREVQNQNRDLQAQVDHLTKIAENKPRRGRPRKARDDAQDDSTERA